jgi:hypothetical protein
VWHYPLLCEICTFFIFCSTEIESRAANMLGKHSTLELHHRLLDLFGFWGRVWLTLPGLDLSSFPLSPEQLGLQVCAISFSWNYIQFKKIIESLAKLFEWLRMAFKAIGAIIWKPFGVLYSSIKYAKIQFYQCPP